jgi:hypothetical protein
MAIQVRPGTFHKVAGAILILRDRCMTSYTRDHRLHAVFLVVVRKERWLMLTRLTD